MRPDFLDDHLRRHGLRTRSPREHVPQGLKSAAPHGTVLDVWNAHQNALDPRKVLNQLRDRRKFPWKTLAFDQQIRPPYSGTFTKNSAVVGPRTPLALDPIFDYSYDSGDDWQDDEGGDDVDGHDEVAGQEEEDEEESEGEFDDWLDDDEEEPHVPVEIVASSMEQYPSGMKVIKKTGEVLKRSVKISPYWKGPIWEREVGERIDGFDKYRLQLLNGEQTSLSCRAQLLNILILSQTPLGLSIPSPTSLPGHM